MKDFKEILEETRSKIDAAIQDAQRQLDPEHIIRLRRVIFTHLIEIYASYNEFGDCLPQNKIMIGTDGKRFIDIGKKIEE